MPHLLSAGCSALRFAFLIFKYFPYGGVQRDMLRIAKDCVSKGHQVTIYTGSWRGDVPRDNIRVELLKARGILNHQRHQSLIDGMAALIQRDAPDLIVGFNRMPGLDVYYAADPCFLERAHHDRGWWYRFSGRYRFFAGTERAVFGAESRCHVLLLSEHDRHTFQYWYQTPSARLHILPPSIPDFADFDRNLQRHALRQEFGLPEQAHVLLMVGSAFVRKGLDRSIRALAALPNSLRSNAWLVAVGEDRAEPMTKLARELGVADRVIITAGRHDVAQLMQGADVLMHLARSELAGIVIIEALTVGLPVMVTAACGYAQHVADAAAGVVLPEPFDQLHSHQLLAMMLESSSRQQWSAAGMAYAAAIAARHSRTVEADLLEQYAK